MLVIECILSLMMKKNNLYIISVKDKEWKDLLAERRFNDIILLENSLWHKSKLNIKQKNQVFLLSSNIKYFGFMDKTIIRTMSNSSGMNKLNCDTFKFHSIKSKNLYSLKRGW